MSDANDLSEKLQKTKISSKTDKNSINILLLGSTGVGKSTFINAVANYTEHKTFSACENGKLVTLIPTNITIHDKNQKDHKIFIDSAENDKNETLETGKSQTEHCKVYTFQWADANCKIRLIDTPGMGDTRGIERDNENFEDILAYISQETELHAICCIFRSEESRITPYFNYCINQILSRLDKSASMNFIFIFTGSRGSNYTPGETLTSLRKLLAQVKDQPPNVEIPLNNNVFCFDNESFRVLAALKNNIQLDNAVKQSSIDSWNKSKDNWWKLIEYIVGTNKKPPLKPHLIQNTISVNEIRRFIIQLTQPLAEIVQHIHFTIKTMERHEQELEIDNQSLEDLKGKLFIPAPALELIALTQPITVCTNLKCSTFINIHGVKKQVYSQRCHDPCYLRNVPQEIIGTKELLHCTSINQSTGICHKCTCHFSIHMHYYYRTKITEHKEKDANIEKNVKSKEEALRKKQEIIRKMHQRKAEMEDEHDQIVKATACCVHFMRENTIAPFNDSYKPYIKYLIEQERSQGKNCDEENIKKLEKLLRQYDEMLSMLEKNSLKFKEYKQEFLPTNEIKKQIDNLFKLKHFGAKIKEMYYVQKNAHKNEHKHTEYVHQKAISSKNPNENKPKPKKEKKDEKKGGQKTAPPSYQEATNSTRHPQQPPPPLMGQQGQFRPPPPQHGPPGAYGGPYPYHGGYPGQYGPPPPRPPPPQHGYPPYTPPAEGKREIKIILNEGGGATAHDSHQPPHDPYYQNYYQNYPGYYPPPPNYGPGPSYGHNYPPPPPHYQQNWHGPPGGQYPPPPPPHYQQGQGYQGQGYNNQQYQPGPGQNIPNRSRSRGGRNNQNQGNKKNQNQNQGNRNQSKQFKNSNRKKNNSQSSKQDSDDD